MSGNTFSVGRDCQVVVMASSGRVDLEYVTAFESRQITASVRVDLINGTHLGAELPKGWEGSFELERGNSAVEDFIAQVEAAFYAGQALSVGTMYQYINETDGSTSTYQFSSVVFKLSQAGIWKGDASVRQNLEFFGSTRTRL